jgi:hypothetical protein
MDESQPVYMVQAVHDLAKDPHGIFWSEAARCDALVETVASSLVHGHHQGFIGEVVEPLKCHFIDIKI